MQHPCWSLRVPRKHNEVLGPTSSPVSTPAVPAGPAWPSPSSGRIMFMTHHGIWHCMLHCCVGRRACAREPSSSPITRRRPALAQAHPHPPRQARQSRRGTQSAPCAASRLVAAAAAPQCHRRRPAAGSRHYNAGGRHLLIAAGVQHCSLPKVREASAPRRLTGNQV